MTTNCTQCGTESGDCTIPEIVLADKYVSLRDRNGCLRVLEPNENSLLIHSTGAKPVKWANGSTEQPIRLPNLKFTPDKVMSRLIAQDTDGTIEGFGPDPENGKQQLVSEGGRIYFENWGVDRTCFTPGVVPEADASCGLSWLGISECGPLECLVKIPAYQYCPPAGQVVAFAGVPGVVPDGWVYCDGRLLDSTDPRYTELFGVIGYNFGKNGTTFAVPDLRGRFIRGVDDGLGRDPDAGSRTESATGSNVKDNVGSYQDDAIIEHVHATYLKIYYQQAYAQFNSQIDYILQGDPSDYTQVFNTEGANTASPLAPSYELHDDPKAKVQEESRPKNVYVNFIISLGCIVEVA